MPALVRTGCTFLLILIPFSLLPLQAQSDVESASEEPAVLSLFPLGAQQGQSLEVEMRGRNLEGTYAIWSNTTGLKVRVEKVEEIELQEKEDYDSSTKETGLGHRVLLELRIDSTAKSGVHSLWLVSPRGVSNAVPFWIHSDPVIPENEGVHDAGPFNAPEQAQEVTFPVVINGRIRHDAELDYYEFEAPQGQELAFEMIPWTFGSQFALYEPTGSWFDSGRARQLAMAVHDEYTTAPQLTHRFGKSGRYLAQVGFFAHVSSRFGEDSSYQLRITPTGQSPLWIGHQGFDAIGKNGWQERAFDRRLESDRLQILWSRTLKTSRSEAGAGEGGALTPASDEAGRFESKGLDPADAEAALSSIREREPNERTDQALEVSFPLLIEGAIERPGDIDSFKFTVKDGERLAFEIETPATAPPFFNPRVGIVDGDGIEFLTNIYKRMGRQFQFYRKTVEPKTVYTFELGGEYTLQVRDISSRHGGPNFVYRLLIRPQIPHVGELKLKEKWVNLTQGEAKKLTVITGQEEGFSGEIALRVENLPPGVEVFPGTEVEPDRGPNPDEGPKERFVAKSQKATILLMAGREAPVTTWPQFVRITARPVMEGQPGEPLPVGQIPLMVVKGADVASAVNLKQETRP